MGIITKNANIKGLDKATLHSTATYQIAYDHAINPRFSLGVAVSKQKTTFVLQSTTVTIGVSPLIDSLLNLKGQNSFTGSAKVTTNRTNLALRGLIHYGTDYLDMYSGARLGISVWNGAFQTDISGLRVTDISKKLRVKGAFFAPQIILFGLRGYVTDHIGLGVELAVGSSYFAATQLNYRF
ncbi:MAG: hypothetical protein RLZZ292_1237 [Bacteroidota bacterium]